MTTIESLLAEVRDAWDDPERLGWLGRELHDRNRLDLARPALERVVALVPEDGRSWAYLAYCHFRALRDEEGRTTLREALTKTADPIVVSALSHFTGDAEEKTKLKQQLEAAGTPGARASLLAHEMWEGEPAPVLDRMRRLAAEHPDDAEVRNQLLWSLMGLKGRKALEGLDLVQEGVPLAEREIAADPERVHGYWMRAQMHLAEEDWDGVLESTGAALERFPDEETQMQLRARALAKLGRTDEAKHLFARAIGAKPSFVGARIELARLLEKEGELALAEQLFREAPAANPGYVFGPVSLALFLARQERWEEAETAFREVWPKVPAMWQGSIRQNPEAGPLLERPAVRALFDD